MRNTLRTASIVLLGLLLAGWGYLWGDFPALTPAMAYHRLTRSHLVEDTEICMTAEIDGWYSDNYDYTPSRGDRRYYVLGTDDSYLYCAAFEGNPSPFYGFVPTVRNKEGVRQMGLYDAGKLTATPLTGRIGYALGHSNGHFGEQLPLLIIDTDGESSMAAAHLKIECEYGTAEITSAGLKEDEGFILWLGHSAQNSKSTILPAPHLMEKKPNGKYYVDLFGSKQLICEGESVGLPIELKGMLLRQVAAGLRQAQLTITLYADEEVLCTEEFLLNPDASAIEPY